MLIDTIQKDMITALKSHQPLRKATLAAIIATAKNMAIADRSHQPTDDITRKAVLKELKTAKEQLDTCPSDRPELMDEYLQRYSVIKEYAPEMLSAEAIRQQVKETVSALRDSTPTKGQVMKILMPRLHGKADGNLISQIVTEELENG